VSPTSDAELEFLAKLRLSPTPLLGLERFAPQYHYFSLHQVVAFSGIIRHIPAVDRASLSEVTSVLYDELGRGDPTKAHSVLFEDFAKAVGSSASRLPLPKCDVLPGVDRYVHNLRAAFGESSTLAAAVAAYVFLEASAVNTYGPFLDTLRTFRELSPDCLRFFDVHATLEPQHLRAAYRLGEVLGINSEDPAYVQTSVLLSSSWNLFWSDLVTHCWE
jgi:hypothetical protein